MEDWRNNIEQNRDLFDSQEPMEGHMERFAEKLASRHAAKSRFSFGYILKAAAVTLLIVISGLWVYEHRPFQSKSVKIHTLGDLSPEYKEVEQYYQTTVNFKYNQIRQFDFQDSTQKQMLIQELEAMDSIYDELRHDLQMNPGDKRIINAMIQHYQTKVTVMNHIINQLQNVQQVNNEKNNNHESTTTI